MFVFESYFCLSQHTKSHAPQLRRFRRWSGSACAIVVDWFLPMLGSPNTTWPKLGGFFARNAWWIWMGKTQIKPLSLMALTRVPCRLLDQAMWNYQYTTQNSITRFNTYFASVSSIDKHVDGKRLHHLDEAPKTRGFRQAKDRCDPVRVSSNSSRSSNAVPR